MTSLQLDNRRIEFSLYNQGLPRRALFQSGTPGTRWLSGQLIDAAKAAGYELLVIDRPGYGRSARLAGRRVIDVVDDVRAVIDQLGWDRFVVWGGSGGGPHALAIAAGLPDRVIACASVVGLAPYDAPGLDWYAGMSAGNVEEFHAAATGEQAYRPLVERLAAEALASVESGGPQVGEEYQLPEVDRQAMAARQAAGDYLERMRATYADGVDGWIDDGIAFTLPWGFELDQVTVPTSIWFGTADVLVTRAHQEYLRDSIAQARFHELPGGHLLSDDDLAAIYGWLANPRS